MGIPPEQRVGGTGFCDRKQAPCPRPAVGTGPRGANLPFGGVCHLTIERRQYREIDIDVLKAEVHGLTVLIVPRPGFQRRYAAFSTRYGGNDLEFVPRGGDRPLRTPA